MKLFYVVILTNLLKAICNLQYSDIGTISKSIFINCSTVMLGVNIKCYEKNPECFSLTIAITYILFSND